MPRHMLYYVPGRVVTSIWVTLMACIRIVAACLRQDKHAPSIHTSHHHTFVHQCCPDTAAAPACQQACVWLYNNHDQALMSQYQCREKSAWLDLQSVGRRQPQPCPRHSQATACCVRSLPLKAEHAAWPMHAGCTHCAMYQRPLAASTIQYPASCMLCLGAAWGAAAWASNQHTCSLETHGSRTSCGAVQFRGVLW